MSETIKLEFPLTFEGKSITEISLRRPLVRDLRALDKARKDDAGELAHGIAMISQLAGLPVSVLDEMDAGDFATVSDVLAGFMRLDGREEFPPENSALAGPQEAVG